MPKIKKHIKKEAKPASKATEHFTVSPSKIVMEKDMNKYDISSKTNTKASSSSRINKMSLRRRVVSLTDDKIRKILDETVTSIDEESLSENEHTEPETATLSNTNTVVAIKTKDSEPKQVKRIPFHERIKSRLVLQDSTKKVTLAKKTFGSKIKKVCPLPRNTRSNKHKKSCISKTRKSMSKLPVMGHSVSVLTTPNNDSFKPDSSNKTDAEKENAETVMTPTPPCHKIFTLPRSTRSSYQLKNNEMKKLNVRKTVQKNEFEKSNVKKTMKVNCFEAKPAKIVCYVKPFNSKDEIFNPDDDPLIPQDVSVAPVQSQSDGNNIQNFGSGFNQSKLKLEENVSSTSDNVETLDKNSFNLGIENCFGFHYSRKEDACLLHANRDNPKPWRLPFSNRRVQNRPYSNSYRISDIIYFKNFFVNRVKVSDTRCMKYVSIGEKKLPEIREMKNTPTSENNVSESTGIKFLSTSDSNFSDTKIMNQLSAHNISAKDFKEGIGFDSGALLRKVQAVLRVKAQKDAETAFLRLPSVSYRLCNHSFIENSACDSKKNNDNLSHNKKIVSGISDKGTLPKIVAVAIPKEKAVSSVSLPYNSNSTSKSALFTEPRDPHSSRPEMNQRTLDEMFLATAVKAKKSAKVTTSGKNDYSATHVLTRCADSSDISKDVHSYGRMTRRGIKSSPAENVKMEEETTCSKSDKVEEKGQRVKGIRRKRETVNQSIGDNAKSPEKRQSKRRKKIKLQ